MPEDQTDPDDGWSSMAEAAARVGLSELGFWRLTRAESFEVRRRDNRAQVRRADVEAYLERSRSRRPPPDDGPVVP